MNVRKPVDYGTMYLELTAILAQNLPQMGEMEKLGHGVGYKYAHDYPNHYVKQQYLPDGLTDRVFYKPTDIGYEAKIKAHMDELHRDCDT